MYIKNLTLSLVFLLSTILLNAQMTFTGPINDASGNPVGSITIVIDETVCLAAGTCVPSSAGAYGFISGEITIDSGCGMGTYPADTGAGFILGSNGVPDLTMDLLPQLSFLSFIFSTTPFISYNAGTLSISGCPPFTIGSLDPVPACEYDAGSISTTVANPQFLVGAGGSLSVDVTFTTPPTTTSNDLYCAYIVDASGVIVDFNLVVAGPVTSNTTVNVNIPASLPLGTYSIHGVVKDGNDINLFTIYPNPGSFIGTLHADVLTNFVNNNGVNSGSGTICADVTTGINFEIVEYSCDADNGTWGTAP